jgi:hypothetical protein
VSYSKSYSHRIRCCDEIEMIWGTNKTSRSVVLTRLRTGNAAGTYDARREVMQEMLKLKA